MPALKQFITAVLALASVAASQGKIAQGQPPTKRLQVAVYSVSGEYVYFQVGHSAGLRPGDLIMLSPPGAAQVRAIVKEVSKKHTRAKLQRRDANIALGTKGIVDLPRSRFVTKPRNETEKNGNRAYPSKPSQQSQAPDHPPWQQGLDGREQNLPLLAPISSRKPEERAMKIHGRAWFNTDYSQSKIGGTNRFLLADIGTDTTFENPFGSGGELRLRGDLFSRRSDLALGRDTSDSEFRLDRLSYSSGFADDADLRWQVGRFLPVFTPEFGVLDGGSLDYRLGTGDSRVSFAIGGAPDPRSLKSQNDDYQVSFFYNFSPTEDRSFELGAGYMKSWTRGDLDRDLFLFRSFYRPSETLSFHSSLNLDYYTGSDRIKAKGFEITQFQTNANWTINRDNGASLYIDYFRTPEFGRTAFFPVEATTLLEQYVFRTSLRTWHRLDNTTRLDFTLAPWTDNIDDGVNMEAKITLSDLLFENGAVGLDLFRREGTYNEGYGARLSCSGFGLHTNWRVAYELSSFDNKQQLVVDDSSLLHAFTGSLDWNVYQTTDLLFNLDVRKGDNIDSQSLGIYLQTRF